MGNLSCLSECSTEFLLACDVNQDLTQDLDTLAPMARLRACLNLTGLDIVDPGCNTWFGRGLATKIDFFLVRLPALDDNVHVRHVSLL